MTFGEALKRFRDGLGLSQAQVARDIGLHPPQYRRYENGQAMPSVGLIYKLTDKYNVSSDYLLGLSDTPHPAPYDEQEVHRLPYDEQEVRRAIEFRDSWLKFNRLRNEIQADGQVSAQ